MSFLWTPANAEQTSACPAANVGQGRVARVVDAQSFVLGNGQEVKLAAIEAPASGESVSAKSAKDALGALLNGRDVVLAGSNTKLDRYGRLSAFVRLQGDSKTVQQALIAGGNARVSARISSQACALELLDAERQARAAKLGLWADPVYEIMSAENPGAILSAEGHFALIEGKVWSVRESRGIIYVNFARRWSEGFAATIRKRNAAQFAAVGMDLKKLAGQAVRVRGWIEMRRTPQIEATGPWQIEMAEAN